MFPITKAVVVALSVSWLGYGLDDWCLIPGRGGKGTLFRHRFQTCPGAHLASYPVGTGGSVIEYKAPGAEADHSLPASAEIKNAWRYTSTRLYVFMAWCLV
jgi:hypothetical protein